MQGELDELEREEFFRLKKVQDKKERETKKRKAAEKVALEAAEAHAAATGDKPIASIIGTVINNIMDTGADDPDVIF